MLYYLLTIKELKSYAGHVNLGVCHKITLTFYNKSLKFSVILAKYCILHPVRNLYLIMVTGMNCYKGCMQDEELLKKLDKIVADCQPPVAYQTSYY